MVESLSTVPDFITSQELEEGIISGRITTFSITEGNLTYYQQAARKTNFEVTIIAKPGEHYITEEIKPVNLRRRTSGQNISPTITAVKSKLQVKAGYVGISLKRPKGVPNDIPFHTVRQKIQPV